MNRCRLLISLATIALCCITLSRQTSAASELTIEWKDNYLTIDGGVLDSRPIVIHYLEAYCRPDSTDREWSETVIGHQTRLISASADKKNIQLQDRLSDGVIVDHVITVGNDQINFELVASNPTKQASDVAWAQPCIRIDKFTGCSKDDARETYPDYIRKCFLFVDGKLTRMPTQPWATKARYIPGQVYCPADVDRDDVNPRPLSPLIPSNGLCGCFSDDEKKIMAVAWSPYQEIFQGVITCLHNDFRVGGLMAGESKTIRGRIYIADAKPDELLLKYQRDFDASNATD